MSLIAILDNLLESLHYRLNEPARNITIAEESKTVVSRWDKLISRLRKERDLVRAALKPRSLLTEDPSINWQKRAHPLWRETRDIAYRHRTQLLQRLHQIDDALLRFNRGSYGLCVKCAARISPRRLSDDAAASRCYACQRVFKGPLTLPYKTILKIARQEAAGDYHRYADLKRHKKFAPRRHRHTRRHHLARCHHLATLQRAKPET
jgi:RNA polymerase-binding transcription factor DksA